MVKKYKILLFSDVQCIISLLTELLKIEGYSVSSTSGTETTFNKYLEEKPDTILIDPYMNEDDTIQFIVNVRKIDSNIPIILLERACSKEKLKEALSLGMFIIIGGTCSIPDLLRTLKENLH